MNTLSEVVNFQIVVPAFNEGEMLEHVLQHAREWGYLKHLVVVDDASTDATHQILERWVQHSELRALRMEHNCKKEGAIRAAMEALQDAGELRPYTLLLDADSMLVGDSSGKEITSQIEQCIEKIKQCNQKAMALRIDVASREVSTVFERCAFADYSAMQVDQWLVSLQEQVWVINGVGGIFETDCLLSVLQDMEPDFETGDLLITVRLMSEEHRISFCPTFVVETFVPVTLRSYFNQRRRWERGTTKILWNEMRFYTGLFARMRLLALWTLVHLSVYLGLIATIGFILVGKMDYSMFSVVLFTSALLWFWVSMIKGFALKIFRPRFKLWQYSFCAVMNSLLWILVTTPARLTGFIEAVVHLSLRRSLRGNRMQPLARHTWLVGSGA